MATELMTSDVARQREIVTTIIQQVRVSKRSMAIAVSVPDLRNRLGLKDLDDESEVHCMEIPIRMMVRRGARRIVIEKADGAASPDPALVKAVVRAHEWWGQLLCGTAKGTGDIAEAEGIARSYVSRVLRLAFLAPDVTARILNGRHPPQLTAWKLIDDRTLPISWHDQRINLGFTPAER